MPASGRLDKITLLVRGMTRDASMYPDPEAFRPERFLEMDASTAAKADPRNMVFGFGRR